MTEPTPDAQLPQLEARQEDLQIALLRHVQREQFETWFRRAQLRPIEGDCVRVAVQNTFTRDWIQNHYQDVLARAVQSVFGPSMRVELVVDAELTILELPANASSTQEESAPIPEARAVAGERIQPSGAERPGPRSHGSKAPEKAAASTQQAPNRLLWDSDVALNSSYRFDNFVVGPCNRFAHAAAMGVSESPGRVYNPFFLHGSVGLGKTHLLQSLCYAMLERTQETRILYLSCETFVNHFIGALEYGDLTKFRNKYRNVDVLVVDDIHMLANKERTQEEFFHTFNTLYNAGKQIVLSSDSSPKEIPSLQERLVSRFKWGLITEIEPPCFETRMAIVKRKSKERGHELPDDVATLLAENVDSNIRELEGAVTRVLGFASLSGQALTVEMACTVLRDVFSARPSNPTMEEIMRVVMTHYNIKLSDLQSRRRTNAIAHPRQIGMYLLRKTTRHSLEEIGGFFGGRDHSTVLYAIERVEAQIQQDARFKERIAGLLSQLQRNHGS
jgi:chromosomal replication initiator protein